MKLGWWRLIIVVMALVAANASHAKPLVLASLKPLGLIISEVSGGLAEVDTLLPPTASHHDYPLKVSDHSRLQRADVVVWIGPELESFLQKPLAKFTASKVIEAYQLPGLYWPPEVGHTDHAHERDPHLWLDPRNAIVLAQAVVEKLVQIDPGNANSYRSNLRHFKIRIELQDRQILQALAPVKTVGFAVYHEGFNHFVGRYGLHQLDYVTFTPEQKPGARHMYELRQKLAKEGKCLFLEPYNNMQAARELAQELHLRVATLDALGMEGVNTYSQLLENMSAAFLACLADTRNQ